MIDPTPKRTSSPAELQFKDVSAALDKAAHCLELMAHPQRLQLLEHLAQSPATAHELAHSHDWSLADTHQHLHLLQQCGFLARLPEQQPPTYRVHQPILKEWLDALHQQSFHCTAACSLPNNPFFSLNTSSPHEL